MTNHKKRWLLTVLLAPLAGHAQVSAEDAQTLPVAQLARKALGAAGSLMVEVERPSWGQPLRRFGAASSKWPPPGPPPLHRLRFFGKAVVTGSQFGMCGADWVTVNFEESGDVESLEAERRYGVEGAIYRKPGKWTYEESGKICDSARSTRDYFPAPDPQAGLEIALFTDAVQGRGPFAKQSFSFSCSGICREGRALLKSLKLSAIDRVREIDCEPTKLRLPSCFEVVVGESEIGPFPKTFRVYGSNYMNKVVINAVKVDVGSTLE